jgi:hypothetical protein
VAEVQASAFRGTTAAHATERMELGGLEPPTSWVRLRSI